MIDPDLKVREYLASLGAVSAVFGARIYAGRRLPAGYNVTDGPALLLATRGGKAEFHSQVWRASLTVRVFAESEALARSAAGVAHDAINDTKSGTLVYVRLEDGTLPMLLSDPETNWPFVLMYVMAMVRAA